jgi:RimJ/RimL family protein N-acetyltransferase
MLAKNELNTNDDDIKLVFPNVDRDAPKSVEWLSGEVGHSTMLLMGNSEENANNIVNMPHDQKLIEEQKRLKEFIEKPGELNWTIQYKGNPVGAIWVDLKDKLINLENGKKTTLKGPSPHIMIGDIQSRGKGIGPKASEAVMDYLLSDGEYSTIYTRARTDNQRIINMLTSPKSKYIFIEDGSPYKDENGLEFQNFKYEVGPLKH